MNKHADPGHRRKDEGPSRARAGRGSEEAGRSPPRQRATGDSEARAAASREARSIDGAALVQALAGTPTHAADCSGCGAAAHAGHAGIDAPRAAAAGEQAVHGEACACAGCAATAARATGAEPDAECPGVDVEDFNRKVKQAAQEAAQGAGGDGPPAADGPAPAGGATLAAPATMGGEAVAALGVDVTEAAAGASRGYLAALLGGPDAVSAEAGTVAPGKPAGFPGILGLTTLTFGAYGYPDLKITVAEQEHYMGLGASTFDATIAATTSTDAVLPCVAAPAGDHVTGTIDVPAGKDKKGTVTCDIVLRITPAFNAKIVAAEQEHLDDMGVAYNLSLVAAAAAVNGLVGTKFTDDSDAKARDKAKNAVAAKLDAKLTADPATWRTVMRSLGMLTISGRDSLLKHTFGTTKPAVDLANKKVVSELTDGSTDIGTISSATMVTFAKI